jgi:hypothetical protein
VEHEGEPAADRGDALAAVYELACRGDLAAAVGDVDGVQV